MKRKFSFPVRVALLWCFVALIAGLSVAGILIQKNKTPEHPMAMIYSDGALLYSINLSAVTSPYTITVNGAGGITNVIYIDRGCIGMQEADCPDRLCVRMGMINDSLLPVTCLPGRVVIRIEDAKKSTVTDVPDVYTY